MNIYPKQPLPCIHVWEFKNEEDGFFFVCKNCHKRYEYDRSELADMEHELEEA